MISLLWTLTGCPAIPPLTLTDPAPVLESDTLSIEFAALAGGEQATQILTVTNAGDLELSLELSLEGSPDFTVPSVNRPYFLDPQESRTFEITFSPTASISEGVLVLTSDDPELPELEIDLTGYGAIPRLEIDPLDHDFGSLALLCPVDLTVALANTGAADLTISSIAHSGLGFSIDPVDVPFVLAPTEFIEVIVTANLREPGTATGQLFVVSDAPSGQLVANQTAEGDELLGLCD
jgi:hypothetical protein